MSWKHSFELAKTREHQGAMDLRVPALGCQSSTQLDSKDLSLSLFVVLGRVCFVELESVTSTQSDSMDGKLATFAVLGPVGLLELESAWSVIKLDIS